MKKRCLRYAFVPVFAFAFLGVGVASAHGWGAFGMTKATPEEIASHQQERFTQQANLLGISVDEVKNAWAKGQSLEELAKEKGMSEEQLREKMAAAQKQQLQEQLKTLVDKGVITQAQADSRLQFLESKAGNKKMGRPFHRGFKF